MNTEVKNKTHQRKIIAISGLSLIATAGIVTGTIFGVKSCATESNINTTNDIKNLGQTSGQNISVTIPITNATKTKPFTKSELSKYIWQKE